MTMDRQSAVGAAFDLLDWGERIRRDLEGTFLARLNEAEHTVKAVEEANKKLVLRVRYLGEDLDRTKGQVGRMHRLQLEISRRLDDLQSSERSGSWRPGLPGRSLTYKGRGGSNSKE